MSPQNKFLRLTAPPLLSFRKASQTVMANLKSPNMVANSARRRCWDGGVGPPLRDMVVRFGSDDVDVGGGGVETGEGACEPNRRRVDEKRRDGSRLVEEN